MVQRDCTIGAFFVAGLLACPIAFTEADDNSPVGRGTPPIPVHLSAPPSYQPAPPQNAVPFSPLSSRAESVRQQSAYTSPASSQSQWSPAAAFQTDVGANVGPQYASTNAFQRAPAAFPPLTPMPDARPYDGGAPSAVQSVDGSWRDDGRYIVININGQEMKLLKTTTEPAQNGQSALAAFDDHLVPIAQPPQPNDPTDNGILLLPPTGLETIRGESIQGEASPAIGLPAQGRVQGRMLQRGHPLANCYVVIAPWPRGDQADSSVDTREPLSTITNDEGFYLFEHVPPGEYKLTWLPNGAKQWIRRIAMRPDVIVHEGQDVTLKDIRMALQTIN